MLRLRFWLLLASILRLLGFRETAAWIVYVETERHLSKVEAKKDVHGE
jgi:hypothetical protein